MNTLTRMFFSCLILSVAAGLSCKKRDVDINEEPVICSFTGQYRIIESAKDWTVGDTVRLTTDLPACAKKKWIVTQLNSIFSISAHGDSFQHVFAEPGEYSITIVVDGDEMNQKGLNPQISIVIPEPYDPAIVRKMEGMRTWMVYEDSMRDYNRTDSIRHYQETFTIEILDDSTIKFKNNILKAWSYHKIQGVTSQYHFANPSNTELGWVWLTYYFKNDSIECSIHPFKGGQPSAGKHGPLPYGVTTRYYSVR